MLYSAILSATTTLGQNKLRKFTFSSLWEGRYFQLLERSTRRRFVSFFNDLGFSLGSLSDGRQPEVDFLHHWAVVWLKLSGKSSLKEKRKLAMKI